MQAQASASHGGCRIAVKVSYSAKKLDGYNPGTFHVIADGIIEYYHKGEGPKPSKTENYHKEENIPAGSASKAKKQAADKANTHGNGELQKQCEEKKCRQPNQ